MPGSTKAMQTSFTAMSDASREEYQQIAHHSIEFGSGLPGRVMGHLEILAGDTGGYAVDRLTHSLQTATRAQRDGRDDDVKAAPAGCAPPRMAFRARREEPARGKHSTGRHAAFMYERRQHGSCDAQPQPAAPTGSHVFQQRYSPNQRHKRHQQVEERGDQRHGQRRKRERRQQRAGGPRKDVRLR